jgi:hypothetical protein
VNPVKVGRVFYDMLLGDPESKEIDQQEALDLLHEAYHYNRWVPTCFSYGIRRFEEQYELRHPEVEELVRLAEELHLEPHYLHYDIQLRFGPDKFVCFKLPTNW